MSKLHEIAIKLASNHALYSKFEEAGTNYTQIQLKRIYENMKLVDFLDYWDLREAGAANDNVVAGVALSVVESDDIREQARENRDGESRAPPVPPRELSAEGIRAMSNKTIRGKIKTDHSKAVYEAMCEYAGRGIFVHPAHCMQDDGFCSSQYGAVKKAKDLEAKGLPAEMPVPLKGGKMPKGQGWQKEASNDPRMVEYWFDQYGNQQGKTNVSIVTGSRTGVIVIDLDGATGIEAFAELEKKLGPIPVTVESRTGGGGKHLLFRWPEGVDLRNSAKVLGDNIDIRGENGQIIAPPSLHHSGNHYQWAEGRSPADVGLAELPPEWIAAIQGASKITAKEASHKPEKVAAKPIANRKQASNSNLDLSAIGETEKGGEGFNDPINALLLSYFYRHADRHEANSDEIRQAISDHVEDLISRGETDDTRRRYTIAGGYLDDKIADARKYVEEHPRPSRAIGAADLPAGYAPGKDNNAGFIGYFKQDGDKPIFVRVCSTFAVRGEARTEDGDGWSLVIEFSDREGRVKQVRISRGDLAGDSKVIRRMLADAGLWIATDETRKFDALLNDLRSEQLILFARMPGWQGGGFVTPDGRMIGDKDGAEVILDNAKIGTMSGTLEGSIGVMDKALNSEVDHFALAPMAGVAGCLLDFCGLPSFVVAYTGTTSHGKTTALELSASMWAAASGESSLLVTMRATSNGMESFLVGTNGMVACMDEMHLCDDRELDTMVFMITSGETKARARQDGSGRPKLYWTTCAIMSGEIGIADKIAKSGKSVAGGIAARVVEIDVGETKKLDNSDLAALAMRKEHFGHIGPCFAEYLSTRHTPYGLRQRIEAAAVTLTGNASDPLSKRISGTYAVLQVAGELLQEAGLRDKGFGIPAFIKTLKARCLVDVVDPIEKAIQTLQANVFSAKDVTIKALGDEGFRDADGWYENDSGLVCMRADKLQGYAGGAVKESTIVKELAKRGVLIKQKENLAWWRLPATGVGGGGNVKNYRFHRDFFWDAANVLDHE